MAYIAEVSEEQAADELRQLYEQVRENMGYVPRLFQAQGSRPDLVRLQLELRRALFDRGVLPFVLKEELALVVSAVNADSYCIAVHLEMLQRIGVDKSLTRQLARDFESAPVPENEKALFHFAAKLTREPFKIKEADVAALRQQGWDDAAILEATLVAATFNFFNRVATGLGVVPEHVF
ncbi:MAG: peroxidase-related enzyme [Acidobacteria bacterium]|nr:peroxidase-related enzyme [Acidobacteriota bacterium]